MRECLCIKEMIADSITIALTRTRNSATLLCQPLKRVVPVNCEQEALDEPAGGQKKQFFGRFLFTFV